MLRSFYFCQKKLLWSGLLLLVLYATAGATRAATYNLSAGTYPPCNTSWSVSGSTYTCNGNGRVTLTAGDIITSSGNATILANNGFSLAGNTIGSPSVNINLTSSYGTITATGTNTIYGNVDAGSGVITLAGTTVNGTVTSTGNINLTGGAVSGLVTSSSNTITTNGTNLSGGATARSGMSITGGTIAGNFVMTSNNAATFSGVTMTSGSISGASTVTIDNGSALGSGSNSISISSNSGAITVNNSTVYGNLSAPNYSTVNVTNGGNVYGTCSPNSTPANACGAAPLPPTPMNCSAGVSSGITGNYYNNRTLTEPSTSTRSDAPIDFNWGSGAPGASGINADNFSIRWNGYIRATQTGAYRFQTESDDGVRLYINGNLVIDRWNNHSATTDTTTDINLVAGNTYSIALEFYENTGEAVIRLRWRLPGASTYVAIPGGPLPTMGAGLYECAPVASPPVSSCATTLTAGITGDYFNNQTLTSPVTGRRSDGPINFDWGTGAPGVAGIGSNNFSVRWNGYVHVTQSGVHRFQTNSDDGVRLTVNGALLIDQWNDHSVTTHTSAAVNLEVGKTYPIKLEFYENGGFAVAQLLWQTPGSGSYVAIPRGAGSSPISAAGLYECVTPPSSYSITHNPTGITCAAESVTITALNASGSAYNPPAGTVVTLSTTPATGVWLGGNPFTFTGGESSFTRYLQQTTPGTLTIKAESATASTTSTIEFVNTVLRIAQNSALENIPTQVAGVNGSAIAKVISTNPKTGVCEARVASKTLPVDLGFSCNNPTTCVSLQTLMVNGVAIAANNNGAAVSYNSVNLAFNASGEAPMAINYSDVGQVTLHGRLKITASGNDPELTLSANSNPFVVKPYTLAVTSAVQAAAPFKANPGGTSNSTQGFIPAGEKFTVNVQARNALGNPTPNFGNEILVGGLSAERNKIQLLMGCPERNTSLDASCGTRRPDYPLGAVAGNLIIGEDNNSDGITDPYGALAAGAIIPGVWNEVGSFKLEPNLSGTGYLGQGNVSVITPSGILGRFYPSHFTLISSALANSCGSFSYMQQPLTLSYTIEARGVANNKLANYTSAYGTMPSISYVAENANSGVNLSRFTAGAVPTWSAGELLLNSSAASFSRLAPNYAPDGPFESVQVGLQLSDTFDSRSLQNLNMNASTTGICSGGSCNAITLGSTLNLRYGRLRLDDAFGPETANLPVNLSTEYWVGSFFVPNQNDSCTKILRSVINYPAGSIFTPANLTVSLSGGSTTGSYATMNATEVSFTSGNAQHFFTAPSGGGQGSFNVNVDLTDYSWLRFDWNQDGNYSDVSLPTARFGFGSYRGHDRIIYWRERFN